MMVAIALVFRQKCSIRKFLTGQRPSKFNPNESLDLQRLVKFNLTDHK